MTHPRYPSLYRINTLRQSELAAELGAGRPRWDDIRDQGLDFLTQTGFDLVWFPGVWQTGPAGHKVSLPNPRGYAYLSFQTRGGSHSRDGTTRTQSEGHTTY